MKIFNYHTANTSNESISRINLMYERRPAAPIRHSSDSRLYHTPWRGGALSPVPSTAGKTQFIPSNIITDLI